MVPYLHDPSLRTPAAAALRVLRRDQRRRSRTAAAPAAAPATVAAGSAGGAASAAPRPSGASASIVAPPKDYEGIRLGPYKYIEWPDGEKELYDINKDPYELNNMVRDPQLLPDPQLPPHARNWIGGLEDCVGRDLPGSGAENPADPQRAAQGRKQEKEEEQQERRKKGTAGTGTRRKSSSTQKQG